MIITKHKITIGATVFCLIFAFAVIGQAQTEIRNLSLNQPLERQTKGGEAQSF